MSTSRISNNNHAHWQTKVCDLSTLAATGTTTNIIITHRLSFSPHSYDQLSVIKPVTYNLAAEELHVTLQRVNRQLDHLLASRRVLSFYVASMSSDE